MQLHDALDSLLMRPQHTTPCRTHLAAHAVRRRAAALQVWRMTTAGAGATLAHNAPVTRVLFNDNFSEAISADHAGTVSVWWVRSAAAGGR